MKSDGSRKQDLIKHLSIYMSGIGLSLSEIAIFQKAWQMMTTQELELEWQRYCRKENPR